MTSTVQHKICLELNKAGYTGADIDEILPAFMAERRTFVGLTWKPSAEGPESFTLGIIVGLALSSLAQGFISELSKDLYLWSKSKLLPLFKRKRSPVGTIEIALSNLTIFAYVEEINRLPEIFERLPELLARIDPNIWDGEWVIECEEGKEWVIRHCPPKVDK